MDLTKVTLKGDSEKSIRKMKYREFLESHEWKELSSRIIKRDGNRCVCCGCNKNLQVHHLCYAENRDIKDEELITLCKNCHDTIERTKTMYLDTAFYKGKVVGWANTVEDGVDLIRVYFHIYNDEKNMLMKQLSKKFVPGDIDFIRSISNFGFALGYKERTSVQDVLNGSVGKVVKCRIVRKQTGAKNYIESFSTYDGS